MCMVIKFPSFMVLIKLLGEKHINDASLASALVHLGISRGDIVSHVFLFSIFTLHSSCLMKIDRFFFWYIVKETELQTNTSSGAIVSKHRVFMIYIKKSSRGSEGQWLGFFENWLCSGLYSKTEMVLMFEVVNVLEKRSEPPSR